MTTTIKTFMAAAIISLMPFTAKANDGVYYVNGSHLEPLQETDIAIKKEVLTITLSDNGMAYVEVDYQFMNNGQAKDVTMGFEANAPYNDGEPVKLSGAHPYISDFSVVMNGQTLNYRNGLVFAETFDDEYMPKEMKDARQKGQYYVPIDLNQWKFDEEDSERLHNDKTDEYATHAYAYYFNAHFNKGLNTVRHTYAYRMSFGVGRAFDIPYWLLPAMRWANHQIDDFTLRIRAPKCTKHFIIDNTPFTGAKFRVTEGKGKTRVLETNDFDGRSTVTEVVLRDGTLEWHGNNYRPKTNMNIESADVLTYLVEWGNKPIPTYYDSGDTYMSMLTWSGELIRYFPAEGTEEKAVAFAKRVNHNLPYAHRGYVFKNAKLRRYFESQWWYMPDPAWKPTDNSFTQHEQELMREENEENK